MGKASAAAAVSGARSRGHATSHGSCSSGGRGTVDPSQAAGALYGPYIRPRLRSSMICWRRRP
eukprot:7536149-Heterocapsa_arctica.AAC.1